MRQARLAVAASLGLLGILAVGLGEARGDEPEKAEAERLDFAGDLYMAGDLVEPEGAADDVFAAGDRVRVRTGAAGDAALAGRFVESGGAVGGDLYAAGWSVDVTGEVTGDATLAGYTARVLAPVGGVLRIGASDATVTAPVGGAAVIGARHLALDAAIEGDARIAAESVSFGPDARIGGTLTLVAEADVAVPESVVPPERLQRPETREIVVAAVLTVLGLALVVLAVQAAMVAAAPYWVEERRDDIAERPFGRVGAGFLGLAALIGAVPLLGVTVIGAPLIPVALVAVAVAAVMGYALGVLALGSGVWQLAAGDLPRRFLGWMGAGLVGLAIALTLALLPVLGWIFGIALMLAGVGALAVPLVRAEPG
jgi:hypothetical protein